MNRVGIIDVGVGNIHTIERMLQKVGRFGLSIRRPEDFQQCDALIIPGVGSAASFLSKLKHTKLDRLVTELSESDIKVVGICLGMQILGGTNEEAEGQNGLNLIPYRVVKNENAGGIPSHTGWMTLPETSELRQQSKAERVFFNHRYTCVPDAELDYEPLFNDSNGIAYLHYQNFYAMQFHPEKSQHSGLNIMNNILGNL